MKMSKEDYSELSAMFKQAIAETSRDGLLAHVRHIVASGQAGDVEKRVRWDLIWSIRDASKREAFFSDAYKKGLNDDHIDTALRSIAKDCGLEADIKSVLSSGAYK